jgi:biotin synthase
MNSKETTMQTELRHDWRIDEIRAIHDRPLLSLVFDAASVHRAHHDPAEMQVCRLINIKTGACPEDCGYCSQSAHWQTGVEPQALLDKAVVLDIARTALANGASRVCMGAAWRDVRDGVQFDRVLDIVRDVSALGVEVCCTLGMLTEAQAKRLEEAGLHAYNHNLDTSRAYYDKVVTTRTYDDRLRTIDAVRTTRVTVCTGGIMGLGERVDDRIALLQTLASLDPHPESVPINILARIPGTPMADNADVPFVETLRMIATARILMPRSVVRLSAGRVKLSTAEQALCFLAGANSIFSSDARQMLTKGAPSADYDEDRAMLALLGLQPRRPAGPTAEP